MVGLNGMSTHLGHVMLKQTMSKTMAKMRQKTTPSVDPNLNIVRFKVRGPFVQTLYIEKDSYMDAI